MTSSLGIHFIRFLQRTNDGTLSLFLEFQTKKMSCGFDTSCAARRTLRDFPLTAYVDRQRLKAFSCTCSW
jgi:hypothetical protein